MYAKSAVVALMLLAILFQLRSVARTQRRIAEHFARLAIVVREGRSKRGLSTVLELQRQLRERLSLPAVRRQTLVQHDGHTRCSGREGEG